jgi:hypothetical protein
MEQSTETRRITKVRLVNDEFQEAIKNYLKSKGVIDTEHHVVIDIVETRDERGVELDVALHNYNKDNNIYKTK